jgi:hypothetical protein
MKIRSDIHAGMTFAECDVQRDCWKQQAELMEKYANGSGSIPSGLQFPPYTCSGSTPPPSGGGYPTSGGGYVNGVYYPDKSGVCGSSTSGSGGYPSGGYVNGVYYPDKSGVCV